MEHMYRALMGTQVAAEMIQRWEPLDLPPEHLGNPSHASGAETEWRQSIG